MIQVVVTLIKVCYRRGGKYITTNMLWRAGRHITIGVFVTVVWFIKTGLTYINLI